MKRMKYNITYGEDDEPTSVTVYWRGKVFVAQEGHPNFTLVVDALEQKRPAGEVIDLFDVKGALARGFSLARKVVQAITDQTISRVQLREEELTVTRARREPAVPEDDPRSDKRYEWMTEEELQEVEASDNPREVETRILAERAAADVSKATKKPVPPPRVVAGEADTPENLDDLNQRQLQALHKELGLGGGVGKSNAWLRGRIMEARDPGGIPDDDGLDALKQRELQTLAKRLGVGVSGVGKTNAWLKDRIREKRAQHLTDVAGKVEIGNGGRLYFDGEEMNGALADAIVAYHKQGHKDFTPLVRFMAKLQENPNPHSREHLYQWMGHLSFAIHEDGDLIAYKGVDRNTDHGFVSCHSYGSATVNGVKYSNQAIPNPIGGVVSMPREEVTFDPKVGCSKGLHVGTVSFAADYGNTLVEVKIHPADVVSVPTENLWQKLRVCKYTVIRECSREEARELSKARLTAV